MTRAAALALLASALAAACAHPGPDPRAAWLGALLLDDNRELLAREPDLVAEKLARMSRDPFAYFRGSLRVFAAEVEPTAFAARVAVVGDPHPENLGSFRSGAGEAVVDFNDFDAAGHGPFVHDVRRLAAGFAVAAEQAGLRRKRQRRVARRVAEGYAHEIGPLPAARPPLAIRRGAGCGRIVDALLGAAARAAAAGRADGDPVAIGAALPAEDAALLAALLAAYPPSLGTPVPAAALAPRGAIRLVRGVASYPNLRFRVRVEGPTSAPEDDWILELKELRRRAAPRAVAIQRRFQEGPDDDPLLGFAVAGGREFRVRQVTPWQRRVDVDEIARKIAARAWRDDDIAQLAWVAGRLLARGHALAPGPDGRPGLPALSAALAGAAADRFVAETAQASDRATRRTLADYRRFLRLLRERGPLLGWRAAP